MPNPDETPAATDDEQVELEEISDETTEPGAISAETEPAPEVADLTAIRKLVLRAHPDVVPELIGGESIEALLASVAPAEAAFQRIATRFPQPATPPVAPSVPAGGGRPAPIDSERLTADEKIRRGLTIRRD